MTTATVTRSYAEGVPLPEYLVQLLGRFPVPGPEQELKLIEKAKAGHEPSLTWLMVGHVRLVSKLAKQYSKTLEDGQDLLQEGMLGIRRAVEKFDPAKGVKFTTYARTWIRGYIRRYSYKNRPAQLRLPEEKQIHLDRVYRLQHQFPDVSLEEIAQKAKLKLDYIEELLVWGRSFQEISNWPEFTCYDEYFCEYDDEIFDCEVANQPQTNVLLIKAPQPIVAESISAHLQTPARFWRQWFRVGVNQFISAVRGEGRTSVGSVNSNPFKDSAGQERLNLSTWPASLSFSYSNSIGNIPLTQRPTEPCSARIICLIKGVFAHAQESVLAVRGRGIDGPADRPGYQPALAPERCGGLGEPGTSGRGYLGFCRQVTASILKPFAVVVQSIRGFANRDGPVPKLCKRKGAVFDLPLHNKGAPQQRQYLQD